MERRKPRQALAHLFVIVEVEQLPHALTVLRFGGGASIGVGHPVLPEDLRVTGQSPYAVDTTKLKPSSKMTS